MNNFVIAHMYPDLLNLYGDRGNLLCLQRRIEWRGHNCEIRNINLQESIDYSEIDMLFMGGGSDREQNLVYNDLLCKADKLWNHIENGLPVLCICGAYQLLGQYYQAIDGSMMEGLGFFKLYTIGNRNRLIGNVLIQSNIEGGGTVVGFENHGGRTHFEDKELENFGTVLKGHGNNGEDKGEGIRYKNLIGTYLHGPLLPKNPQVADFFIQKMAERRNIRMDIPLNDNIETFAHQQVVNKILSSR